MKKTLFAFAAATLLFVSCDGVNLDIDDIPRTLRISVRSLNNTDDFWSQTEDAYQAVSTGNGTVDGTNGDVSITPAQNTYVRSDSVTATASNPGAGKAFAFWLLPARTDIDRDPLSTEGNIRYSDGSAETISLRTDYEESEIIGIFANDGTATDFQTIDGSSRFATSLSGDRAVDLFISLENKSGGSITIRDAVYRIFDENGEALTSWEDFVQDGEQIIANGAPDSLDLNESIDGILDRSEIGNWTVVIVYEDPSTDEVYVVK